MIQQLVLYERNLNSKKGRLHMLQHRMEHL